MTSNGLRIGGLILMLSVCSWLMPAPARADDSRAARQLASDISNSVTATHGHTLRLGDLAVLTLKDRTVWWRLTLGGVPPQAFKNPVFSDPGVAPMGTPLVTLDVTKVVTRRR